LRSASKVISWLAIAIGDRVFMMEIGIMHTLGLDSRFLDDSGDWLWPALETLLGSVHRQARNHRRLQQGCATRGEFRRYGSVENTPELAHAHHRQGLEAASSRRHFVINPACTNRPGSSRLRALARLPQRLFQCLMVDGGFAKRDRGPPVRAGRSSGRPEWGSPHFRRGSRRST
jgi:hypothetical protein